MTADLEPSERVLWTGSPVRHPFLDHTDLVLVPFSALLTVIGLWFALVSRPSESTFGRIWIWAFVAVAVYGVVGRPIVRWLALYGTTYTVTDRRVLVVVKLLGLSRKTSHRVRDLPRLKIVERRDGSGDLRFGQARWRRYGPLGAEYTAKGTLAMRGIADPRRVADLIVLK